MPARRPGLPLFEPADTLARDRAVLYAIGPATSGSALSEPAVAAASGALVAAAKVSGSREPDGSPREPVDSGRDH